MQEDRSSDWKSRASDPAKRRAWQRAADGVAPHLAWYFAPEFGEMGLTDDLCQAILPACWDTGKKDRVIRNMDASSDRSVTVRGVPLLRLSMPGAFVASFEACGTTFVLYRATIDDKDVDFSHLLGGDRAVTSSAPPRLTLLGDVGALVDGTEMPAPRAILRQREERSRAAFPQPVPRPRRIPRAQEDDPPARPAGRTLVPAVTDPVAPRSADSMWDIFGGDSATAPASPQIDPVLERDPVPTQRSHVVRPRRTRLLPVAAGIILLVLLAFLAIRAFLA